MVRTTYRVTRNGKGINQSSSLNSSFVIRHRCSFNCSKVVDDRSVHCYTVNRSTDSSLILWAAAASHVMWCILNYAQMVKGKEETVNFPASKCDKKKYAEEEVPRSISFTIYYEANRMFCWAAKYYASRNTFSTIYCSFVSSIFSFLGFFLALTPEWDFATELLPAKHTIKLAFVVGCCFGFGWNGKVESKSTQHARKAESSFLSLSLATAHAQLSNSLRLGPISRPHPFPRL